MSWIYSSVIPGAADLNSLQLSYWFLFRSQDHQSFFPSFKDAADCSQTEFLSHFLAPTATMSINHIKKIIIKQKSPQESLCKEISQFSSSNLQLQLYIKWYVFKLGLVKDVSYFQLHMRCSMSLNVFIHFDLFDECKCSPF